MLTTAYLGLGANLGDPIQQMLDARQALSGLAATGPVRCSSFYASSPVGYAAQPDFVNCVLELPTLHTPLELLDCMQLIENTLGRERVAANQNAPRMIDIDLLLYGDQRIDNMRLTVPHPRMENRLFVLKPLLELANIKRYQSALCRGLESGGFDGQALHRLVITSS